VIAAELYARVSGYDPKTDSTVRVEAGRLREKLRRYYQQHGAGDPIRITIPRGAYVPQFERAAPVSEVSGAARRDEALRANVPVGWGEWLWLEPPQRTWALLLLATLGLAWASQPWRDEGRAQGRTSASAAALAAGMPAEAVAAWQEGNELLRQDPHSSVEPGMPRTLERALARYQQAVAISPTFAGGWASLAEAYEYASAFVGRDAEADARQAEAAARRAVALDPDLPAAHASLGLVLFYLRWDVAGADAAYRRAIALDPRGAWAIVEYADLLRETGRLTQATAMIRTARTLQPALPVLAVKEAELVLAEGRTDEALAIARAAIDLKGDSARALVVLGMAHEAAGDVEQALTHYRRALDINPRDRRALPALGHLLGTVGRASEARLVLRRLEDLDAQVRGCAWQIAVVHVGLGDHTQALDWLERAFERRQMHVPFMVVEPRFEPLRPRPRFQAMVRRLGLPGALSLAG
jgi:tetratricopeptide (TPR) repeat protein